VALKGWACGSDVSGGVEVVALRWIRQGLIGADQSTSLIALQGKGSLADIDFARSHWNQTWPRAGPHHHVHAGFRRLRQPGH